MMVGQSLLSFNLPIMLNTEVYQAGLYPGANHPDLMRLFFSTCQAKYRGQKRKFVSEWWHLNEQLCSFPAPTPKQKQLKYHICVYIKREGKTVYCIWEYRPIYTVYIEVELNLRRAALINTFLKNSRSIFCSNLLDRIMHNSHYYEWFQPTKQLLHMIKLTACQFVIMVSQWK